MIFPLGFFVQDSGPDLTNLLAWFKASSLILSDTDPVATWSDLSGNDYHATAGNSPVFKTNIIDGKAVVRFTGTSSHYLTTSLPDRAAQTIFMVAKATGSGRVVAYNAARSLTAGLAFDNYWRYYAGHDGNGYVTQITNVEAINFKVFTGRITDTGVPVDRGQLLAYENGVFKATCGIYDGTGVLANTLTLGSDVSGSDYGTFDAAEIMIFDGSLGDTQCATIENYLKNEYGL